MDTFETARKAAAIQAIQLIKDGHVVSLGSGRTMALAVEEISAMLHHNNLNVRFIPTSHQIENVIVTHGLQLTSLHSSPRPDLALDGADQVDDALNLIKGGGAAMMREKIAAEAARRFVVIIEEQKRVNQLSRPVPLEVLPFAHRLVLQKVSEMGARAILREGSGKIGPVITDNGNFVVDADFGIIEDPEKLDGQLGIIPGVVETGLFVDMVDEVYVGKSDGNVTIEKNH